MKRYLLIFLIVVIVVISLAGSYMLGFSRGEKENQEKVEKLIFKDLPAPKNETFILSGTIKEVRDDEIVLSSQASTNILVEWPSERVVKITSNTKMLNMGSTMPNERYEEEMQEYRDAIKDSANASLAVPKPYKEEEVGIGELKIGYSVTVKSSKNIAMSKEFEAESITFLASEAGDNSSSLMLPPQPLPPPPSTGI